MIHTRTVAVLMGGISSEREVSLVSGHACATALVESGHSVVKIDAAGDNLSETIRRAAPDVVFNALHGRYGEDGCIQGLLELLDIPYTHSGVLASSLAMNKPMSKQIYRLAGLPTPRYWTVDGPEEVQDTGATVPYVIKPVDEGSSIGVVLVENADCQLPSDLDKYRGRLMVEDYIAGHELTVSVLGDRPLAITQIISSDWYDYRAKYSDGGSRHVLPADIPTDIVALIMDQALTAHRIIGCRGLSRSDFRWDETRGIEGVFLLETNTQPGMTPTSLSPEQAAHCGISMAGLCHFLVEDASCGR